MRPKFFYSAFIFVAIASSIIFPVSTFAQAVQPQEIKRLPPVNYIRSRDVDIKHVSIDLRFDWEKEQAFGNTTVTLAPFKNLNKFTLDAAMMQIISVTAANGKELKFNYAGGDGNDNLEILLEREYKRGEEISVKINYRTSYVNSADSGGILGGFGRGLRFIKPSAENPKKPRQIWSQGESEFNRYWFPSYDSPNDFRTSELRATVEKPFSVISNGKLLSIKDNGDNTRTFYWKMEIPYSNYLTSIVVGEYSEVKNGEYEGIPIYAYGYPSESKEVALTTKNLPATIKFFSEITGVKYPYPKYAQTFVEDFGGGMENISATTQIKEMIHDERELLDEDSESLQSHELAHQWFGDYVTTRDWGQIWLNESFATYFQALWTEKLKGHEEFLFEDIRNNQNAAIGAWKQGNRRPIVTKNYTDKDALFDTYAYPRGGAVLHTLRKHLGDELFFKSLNRYLTQNAHQPVSTEQLRIAFEETTGQSLDWFFDQWIYKMGNPVFEVTKNFADGKLTLNVKQTQKIDPKNEYPQVEFFQGKIEVEIDGNVQSVWLKPQAENIFTFPVAGEPKLVNFDYESTWIKELKFEKSVDELIYQALNDKDILGRFWAMNQLTRKTDTDKAKILSTLRTIAEKDSFWRIRNAAISAVENVVAPRNNRNPEKITLDDETAQMFLRLSKDEKSLIRTNALSVLSRTEDKKYAENYLAALNDPSYSVIEAATYALALTKSPNAYDALMKLVNTNSWRGRIAAAALTGLAELENKNSFEPAYKIATDKTQPMNVRTAALTVVGATGKGDARAYPLIFENFKRALENNEFRNLEQSLQAIIKIADPRGQQAFDMLKEKFKNQPQILGFVNFYETRFKAALGK